MTSLPGVLLIHWLVTILHSWVWNPYINIFEWSPVDIRVERTDGHTKYFTVGPVADATTKPILDSIIELTNDSVCGLVLFTVLLRSLGQLSVYKSMKLEIEELKRRENFLDKKWVIQFLSFLLSKFLISEFTRISAKKWFLTCYLKISLLKTGNISLVRFP